MSMSLSQARVIDPVLTEVAQGYRHADRVGSTLFPRVEVLQRGGRVIEFGREAFRLCNARPALMTCSPLPCRSQLGPGRI